MQKKLKATTIRQKNVPKGALKDQLQHSSEPITENNDDITPLLSAVIVGSSFPCLKILIQAGANPNMRAGGATPLHVAVGSASIEVIRLLVEVLK